MVIHKVASDATNNALNKYYVYVLLSQKDRKLYIGYTRDLRRRYAEHIRGSVLSTRHRRPLVLVHYEYFVNEKDARAREVFLKSGFGRSQQLRSYNDPAALMYQYGRM